MRTLTDIKRDAREFRHATQEQARTMGFFPRSFTSWAGRTAADIIRYEIRPAIHDRINARGLMQTKF